MGAVIFYILYSFVLGLICFPEYDIIRKTAPAVHMKSWALKFCGPKKTVSAADFLWTIMCIG